MHLNKTERKISYLVEIFLTLSLHMRVPLQFLDAPHFSHHIIIEMACFFSTSWSVFHDLNALALFVFLSLDNDNSISISGMSSASFLGILSCQRNIFSILESNNELFFKVDMTCVRSTFFIVLTTTLKAIAKVLLCLFDCLSYYLSL